MYAYPQIDHNLIKETLKYFKINEPMHVGVYTTIPTLTGLGSSSSLVVGLINCIIKFKNIKLNNKKIISIAYKIEREICGYNGGWQDQIISQIGGFVKVDISKNGQLKIKKIKKSGTLNQLVNKNFMLVYTKLKRDSSTVILSQKKNKNFVIKQYDLIKPLTKEIPNALKKKNPSFLDP